MQIKLLVSLGLIILWVFCFIAVELLGGSLYILCVFNLLLLFLVLRACSSSNIHFLYYLLFGLFFVLPFIFVSDDNFLRQGAYVAEIYLSSNESQLMVGLISIFLYISYAQVSFCKLPSKPSLAAETRENPFLLMAALLSLTVVLPFNIAEALEIYEAGYSALFDGSLGTKKGLGIFLAEQVFLVSSILLLRSGSSLALILLSLYAVSIIFVGQRMPYLIFLILCINFFYERRGVRINFAKWAFLGVIVFPPILLFIQDLREGINAGENMDFLRYYVDIWRVLGISIDTLKAAIVYDGTHPVDVAPFNKFSQLVSVAAERILGLRYQTEGAGFGAEFTRAYSPALFSLDRTFASSSIAEAYFYFGVLGVVILPIAMFHVTNALATCSRSQNFYVVLIFFIVTPKFFTAIRNELFGWVFESVLYLIPIFLVYVSYVLFYRGVKN